MKARKKVPESGAVLPARSGNARPSDGEYYNEAYRVRGGRPIIQEILSKDRNYARVIAIIQGERAEVELRWVSGFWLDDDNLIYPLHEVQESGP